MPTGRMILAVLLMAAPMMSAQQMQSGVAATHSGSSARRASRTAIEPLQITITFIRIQHGKTYQSKTYTVTASAQQADPQIRDDAHYPVKADAENEAMQHSAETDYVDGGTDVDIHNIRKAGNQVSLTLCISTKNYSTPTPKGRPSASSVLSSHEYTISPTVPIGKLASVYSMAGGVDDLKVEIQLMVQPFKP